MGKKLTHEEFIERFLQANDHNLTILSQYSNASTKLHVRCNTHNIEFDTIPSSLLRNCGCVQCGIEKVANLHRLTHEEFIDRLKEKNHHYRNNEFDVVGRYFNQSTHIECRCNKCNHCWSTSPGVLLRGSGCPECGRFSRWDWKRWTHDEFVNAVICINNEIKVLDKYIGYEDRIKFQCKENHVWETTPHSILAGHGCPYCAGLLVWVGFNDLWTTRPDVASLLKDPNDGYKYTYGSNIKVKFKCPECGNIEEKPIAQVSKQGLPCSRCSDGVSYPNKFARALLDQLQLYYHKCEYRPDWAKPYLYDNYFIYNDVEYILEMDGAFHYKEMKKSDRTLDEIRKIDQIKTSLAIQHGINVIRIECMDSSYDYIKNNILSSELNDIFDLSNVDWTLCNEKAQKNLIKEACDLYMSGLHDLNEISHRLHVHYSTVYNYLKNGAKFNWCDYDPKRAIQIARDKKAKRIAIVDDNEKVIHVFDGLRPCERDMKDIYGIVVYRNSIVNACKTHKPYKGFNFRFANETIQN